MSVVADPAISRQEGRKRFETPVEEWDVVAEEWLARNPQTLWREHSDAVNAQLLEKWLPRHRMESILKTDLFDEAVAQGLYPVLAARCRRVVAVDVSPAIISAASRKYPRLNAMTGDVRYLPSESGAFDAVISISTLDHFGSAKEIDTALEELLRVLKPGGTLVLTLDNAANPVVAVRNALPYAVTHAMGLVPYPVGKTLGPDDGRTAVERAGFEVVETTTIMHAPRVVAIPLMNTLARHGSQRRNQRLLATAMAFEKLRNLPTRSLTGHFIAIRARKPGA